MSNSPSHKLGDLVRLKSQPDKCGAVIAVNPSGPGNQYTVLLDGKARSFFASQLVAADLESVVSEQLSADQCRAVLTARYINHPGTSTSASAELATTATRLPCTDRVAGGATGMVQLRDQQLHDKPILPWPSAHTVVDEAGHLSERSFSPLDVSAWRLGRRLAIQGAASPQCHSRAGIGRW
jgi:hypothetical protein